MQFCPDFAAMTTPAPTEAPTPALTPSPTMEPTSAPSPIPTTAPTAMVKKTYLQCMFLGYVRKFNEKKGKSINGGTGNLADSVRCKNEEYVTVSSLDDCISLGQDPEYNPTYVAYNSDINRCGVLRKNTACNHVRAKLNWRYYDCANSRVFKDDFKCVFQPDDTGDDLQVSIPSKPKASTRWVSATTCLKKCEEQDTRFYNGLGGCCQWNQKQNNCRFFPNTPGLIAQAATARNGNKWAIKICPQDSTADEC